MKSPLPAAEKGQIVQQARRLATFGVVLTLCFASPLYELARRSLHSDLYSHILLIPFISLYLVWLKRPNLGENSRPAWGLALFSLIGGLAILAGYWTGVHSGWKPGAYDYLAVMMLSFLFFLTGGCFAFLGMKTLRTLAFPAAFLFLMVPFPAFLHDGIESFFQHTSAQAAYVFLKFSAMPVFREGTQLQLPGIALEVGPQCSGIHSSLVLFITSLLAGHLLLHGRWTRAVLVLAVIPLGIVRNGFRIFVLGQLCVRVSPDMIDSYIHRHGGPIFFVLSLVPFFLLLLFLRKFDTRIRPGNETDSTL